VKSQFCSKIAFVAAGFSLRSRRRMAYCFSQAKACGYRLGLFTNESIMEHAGVKEWQGVLRWRLHIMML
ncbi:MAG: hypothetical protein ABIG11_01865, partial [bacterium]